MISSLIAMGTAFLVFYFTIQYEKNKEKKRLQITNKNRIVHLSSLVTLSIKNIEDITKNLKFLIEKIEDDELEFPLLNINPNNSFDRIYKLLKNENYFLAYMQFFGNTVINEFNNISLEVDYFKMQIEQLSNMHKSAQMYDYERKKQFKTDAENIINISVKLIIDSDIEEEDRKRVDSYINEFSKNHPSLIPETESENFEYYYDFIRRILEKGMKNYYRVPKYNNYLILLKKTSLLFNEIKIQNRSHKEDLKNIRENLNDALITYKEDTSRLLRETEHNLI